MLVTKLHWLVVIPLLASGIFANEPDDIARATSLDWRLMLKIYEAMGKVTFIKNSKLCAPLVGIGIIRRS